MLLTLLSGNLAYASLSPEANALYQKACTLEYKEQYSDAIQALLQAIKINPQEAMLFTKLAGLYADTQDFDTALKAYKKALELKPTDAFIYISIGGIYENKGDYKEALIYYEQAQKIFPDYKFNYLNIANAQYMGKDYKSAIKNYEFFLNVYPEHFEARENLANSYLLENSLESSLENKNLLPSMDPTLIFTSGKTKTGECITKFKLQVANLEDLNHVIVSIGKISEVYDIERVFK